MSARETLAEMRAIEQAATEGPWEAGGGDDDPRPAVWAARSSDCFPRIAYVVPNDFGDVLPEDAEFIAAARSFVPKALDALEAVLALWPDTADPCDCCVHVDCEVVRAITKALT